MPDSTEHIPEELEAADQIPEEATDYKEKWQRAVADLENARKRFETDRTNLLKYGTEALIDDLLPVVDNFYRATEHIPAEQQSSPWVAGIQYIQKNLLDVLEARGLAEIPCKAGDAFDPSVHESIESVENAELPDDSVVEVKSKGYRLHGKLLRPVRVSVNTAHN